MSAIWERVIGENGTVYCCWLFNIHNCENEIVFQRMALSSGILSITFLLLTIAASVFIISAKYRPMTIMFNLYLGGIVVFDFLLYTDAFANNAFGFLLLNFTTISGILGVVSFGFLLVNSLSEISYNEDESATNKLNLALRVLSVGGTVGCLSIGIAGDYYINLGSSPADPLFETLNIIASGCLVVFLLFYCWLVFKLFKKMQGLPANLSNVAKKQVFSVKFLSVSFPVVMLPVVLCFLVLAFEKDLFKIFWLSVLFFAAILFLFPITLIQITIYVSRSEYEKKKMVNAQLAEPSELESTHPQTHRTSDN